jgi:cation/acetate symporter
MIYEFNAPAVTVFGLIVAFTLALSFYLGAKAKSASGFFAASGGIPWFVNGVAFAGDYLSAASFLGICGMIAFYGYDGFLYSIGYLIPQMVGAGVLVKPLFGLPHWVGVSMVGADAGRTLATSLSP